MVLLCKKVLGYSGGVLKKEQVELAFSEADRLQGFGYDEILAAKAAFSYAILLRIAEVSEKCLFFRCWVGREHLPDCHMFSCEALSMADGLRLCRI